MTATVYLYFLLHWFAVQDINCRKRTVINMKLRIMLMLLKLVNFPVPISLQTFYYSHAVLIFCTYRMDHCSLHNLYADFDILH